MCKYLLHGSGLGFFSEDDDDSSNLYPDAWCSECETVKGASGEFADEYARVTFRLVCGACYEESKAKHVAPSETP